MKNNQFSWPRVIDISGAHLLHDIYGAFLAPLFPLLIEKMGLNYFMVGALSVVQRIPSVFNPLIGLFVERKDLRVFVILMPAITVITMSLIGVVENFWQLVILLFIMGWSSAFFHVPGPVLIKRVSGEKTGLGMSVYMLSAELGRSLGPIIIVAAVSWWGLAGTVWLIPVGLMASLLLFFRLRKIAPVHHEGVVNLISSWQLLKDLKAYYFVIAGYSFSQGLLKALLVTFLPTYYTNSGESLWFAAYTLSFFELAGGLQEACYQALFPIK